jgi:hypothetical protein
MLPTEPFFLYPANLWPHKNHQRLLLAFQRFIAQRPESWSLILTGDDFQHQTKLLAATPSVPVRHLGFVSSRMLAELYRRCTALTFFSLYEGFGIPLLEAFQMGAPVLCSNTTSLPEVSGDATLSCDPTDIAAMAALMERVANSPALRTDLRQRGFAQLKRYDWSQSARSLLSTLHAIAEEPGRDDAVLDSSQRASGQPHQAQHHSCYARQMLRTLGGADAVQNSRTGQPPQAVLTHPDLRSDTSPTLQQFKPDVPDDAGLLVSVVLPIADHRGQALGSVRSWARTQTLPRDRYEVIVVSDGLEPGLDAQIRTLLHPQDRLVYGPPGIEARLYDVGARAARGRWLFFTEAHCFGDRQCLEAMVSYLDASGDDGASARSQGIASNYLARMEERLFHENASPRLAPEHWNKIFMRGSALARECYLQAGGLTWRYGLFAEPDLAARLYASGHKIGHAPAAVVRHVNTRSVAELRSSVHDYSGGQCTYLTEHPEGDGAQYFGTPTWWSQRSLIDPRIDRNLWCSLGKSLLQPGEDWQARGTRWIKLLPAAMLGTRWRVLEADWTVWQAQVRCWWWRKRDDRLIHAYRELWPALARQAGVHALAKAQARESVAPDAAGDAFEVAELPDTWHTGMHDREELDGDRFRWSSPVACLKLPLKPGRQVLLLDTHGLRPDVRMAAFLNGHRLRLRDLQYQVGEVQLAIRQEQLSEGPFQYLVLICEPLRPWLHGVPDQRELGLPLFRITSVRAQHEVGQRISKPCPTDAQ